MTLFIYLFIFWGGWDGGGGWGGGPNFFTFIDTSGYNWTSHGPGDSLDANAIRGFQDSSKKKTS